MFYGAYNISKKIITDRFMLFLPLIGMLIMTFSNNLIIYIATMFLAGLVTVYYYKGDLII